MKNKDNVYYLDEQDFNEKAIFKKSIKNNVLRIITINLLIILIALLITFAVTIYQSKANAKNLDNSNINTAITTTKISFVVKELDGQIAVYSSLSDEPIEKYDTYVSSLPKEDQELLSEGIEVSNTKELEQIIEDLTS